MKKITFVLSDEDAKTIVPLLLDMQLKEFHIEQLSVDGPKKPEKRLFRGDKKMTDIVIEQLTAASKNQLHYTAIEDYIEQLGYARAGVSACLSKLTKDGLIYRTGDRHNQTIHLVKKETGL